jgi:hypothetical protein
MIDNYMATILRDSVATISSELNDFYKDLYLEINKIEIEYEDKYRDIALIERVNKYTNEMVNYVNRLNNIEQEAISLEETEIMTECESLKSLIINTMIMVQERYL